jgi:hypothetical protein
MKSTFAERNPVTQTIRDLVNTSVEDMQSSLGCNNFSPAELQKALVICTRRGEKTKVVILKRKIRKIIALSVAVETEE